MTDTKRVPREPTPDMIAASQLPYKATVETWWRMHDAAPDTPSAEPQCQVHSGALDRSLRCTCPIGPKCPNCGAQEVYRKTADGLPIKACRGCSEEWEDDETFRVRARSSAEHPAERLQKHIAGLIEALHTEQRRTARYLERAETAERALAEARKDAERYRWIRQSKYRTIASAWLLPLDADTTTTSEQLDAAIDAAIAEGKQT